MPQLPGGVVELDELEVIVVVDNETDTLSSVDEGAPQTTEIARLMGRLAPHRRHEGRDAKVVFDKLCCACHGYSALLRGRRGGVERTILFDVGPYADVWLTNARLLGIDLSAIERVFLSHWHFDHSGGLPVVVERIAKARAEAGRPPLIVDVHPDRPDQRGFVLPSGAVALLADEPTFAAIASAGGTVERHALPHPLADGFFFGSGPIDRVTEYEKGFAGHITFRGEEGASDPLLVDERFLAACVRGRGVSVFSACSHAGVVNACLHAKQFFPGSPVDLVLGGYHLAGKAMEPRIEATVRDLRDRIDPRVVAPGHCTGWRAKAQLAVAFSPGRYAPSVVGSTYRLAAP